MRLSRLQKNMVQPEKSKKARTNEEEINYYTYSLNNCGLEYKEYWIKYKDALPLLYSKAKKTLIIPAAAVASESQFSISNHIQSKERNRLSSKKLKKSILLREKPNVEQLLMSYKNK